MRIIVGSVIILILMSATLWYMMNPLFEKTGKKAKNNLKKLLKDDEKDE